MGIPIFIISFNKRDQLLKSMASYKSLKGVGDIVIHDNGSENPRVVKMLSELEESGEAIVYRSYKISSSQELNNVQQTIADYFKDRPASNYIVTDPDIELFDTKEDLLDVMSILLEENAIATCVGPMLTIDDIPDSYPQKQLALSRHIDQFWKNRPVATTVHGERVFLQLCGIDTTFAMYRAGTNFTRMNTGFRLYEPYQAKHLDWYEPDGDTEYFSVNSTIISHWSRDGVHPKFKEESLYKTDVPKQIYYIENGKVALKEI